MNLKTAKIIFEDEWILVVNKPAGLVVNRSETIKGPTLQDELYEYFQSTLPKGSDPDIGGRSGIVHRLDRETSGLILVAKTKQAFENLQAQFKNREVSKEYAALVHGFLKEDSGSIFANIVRVGRFGKYGVVGSGHKSNLVSSAVNRRGLKEVNLVGLQDNGREAWTDWIVERRFQYEFFRGPTPLGVGPLEGLTKARANYLKRNAREYTLLSIFPKTGRTHQIRVHLKSIGHPVVSDLIYGPNKLLGFDLTWCPRLFLHAKSIEFHHPKTKKSVKFSADLPKELRIALGNLTIDT